QRVQHDISHPRILIFSYQFHGVFRPFAPPLECERGNSDQDTLLLRSATGSSDYPAILAVIGIRFALVHCVWRQLEFPVDDHYFSRKHQPFVTRSPLEPGGPSWPAPRGSSVRSTPRSRSDGPAGRSPPPSSSRP